jgi:hypothetical protein
MARGCLQYISAVAHTAAWACLAAYAKEDDTSDSATCCVVYYQSHQYDICPGSRGRGRLSTATLEHWHELGGRSSVCECGGKGVFWERAAAGESD